MKRKRLGLEVQYVYDRNHVVARMLEHYEIEMPPEEYPHLNACATDSDTIWSGSTQEVRLVHLELPDGRTEVVAVVWCRKRQRVSTVLPRGALELGKS